MISTIFLDKYLISRTSSDKVIPKMAGILTVKFKSKVLTQFNMFHYNKKNSLFRPKKGPNSSILSKKKKKKHLRFHICGNKWTQISIWSNYLLLRGFTLCRTKFETRYQTEWTTPLDIISNDSLAAFWCIFLTFSSPRSIFRYSTSSFSPLTWNINLLIFLIRIHFIGKTLSNYWPSSSKYSRMCTMIKKKSTNLFNWKRVNLSHLH